MWVQGIVRDLMMVPPHQAAASHAHVVREAQDVVDGAVLGESTMVCGVLPSRTLSNEASVAGLDGCDGWVCAWTPMPIHDMAMPINAALVQHGADMNQTTDASHVASITGMCL